MLKSIQLLRAIAALCVVFNHYASYAFGITAGFFGVDIFFIISGFIIAYMVSRNTEYFLVKRLFRIVPLYILGTLMISAIALTMPGMVNNAKFSFLALVKSLLFIPYKIDNSGPILAQGWTLNYEVFFYLIMQTSIILFIKHKKYLTIGCAVLASSLVMILIGINSNVYILNFYRGLLPEFVMGLLLFQVYTFKNINVCVGGGGGNCYMPSSCDFLFYISFCS